MSRKGNWWDNAVAEAFFGSLKKELNKKQLYKSRDLATAAIAEYMGSPRQRIAADAALEFCRRGYRLTCARPTRATVRGRTGAWADLREPAAASPAAVRLRPGRDSFSPGSGVHWPRSLMVRWQDHIVATPDTLHGWPRFRDTRIPVSIVLENLAAGVAAEDLFTEFPTLPKEAIPATLAYAADLARDTIGIWSEGPA